MVVGAHNYVMGSLPWSVKVAVALVGLSGSKEKGFQYLREVANGTGENTVDAKVVLSLFLRRERNFDEARSIMHDLAARYPKDYLFALEESNLQRALGHLQEAAAGYRRVWQMGREGKFGNLHYEMAAWGLGELLRSRHNFKGAVRATGVRRAEPCSRRRSRLAHETTSPTPLDHRRTRHPPAPPTHRHRRRADHVVPLPASG